MVLSNSEIKDKKQLIVEKSKDLFFHYGFKKTSIGDIAKECSMSVGSMYNFFKNKEEILACCAKDCYDESLEVINPILAKDIGSDKKLREVILAIYVSAFEKFKDTKHGFEILMAEFPGKVELDKDSYNTKVGIIKNLLEEGIKEGLFKIDDINKFTKAFLESFARYSPPMAVGMKKKEIEDGVNAIMDIMIMAIKK